MIFFLTLMHYLIYLSFCSLIPLEVKVTNRDKPTPKITLLTKTEKLMIGAVNAIQDAIALANWINVLNADATWDDTAKVFAEYRSERHPWARHAFTDSQVMSKLVAMVREGGDHSLFPCFLSFRIRISILCP